MAINHIQRKTKTKFRILSYTKPKNNFQIVYRPKFESQKFEENEEYLHKHEVGKAIKQNSQTITHKEKYGHISLHKNIKLLCNKRHINKV